MAHDPVRGTLILFGGTSWTGGILANDTWEWGGATGTWTRLVTGGAPSARWGHVQLVHQARQSLWAGRWRAVERAADRHAGGKEGA